MDSIVNARQKALFGAGVWLAVAVLTGCTRNDAASYLNSARAYAAQNDYSSAVIEAKNALQKDPESGEARLILARGLLAQGDPAGAEAEVRKAIAAHASDDSTYPVLARSLAMQGQFDKLVSELSDRKLDTPAARVDMDGWVAIAALARGDSDLAKRLAYTVLGDDPDNARALLILAQLDAQRGDFAAARTTIDKALAKNPDNIDVALMKAQIDLAEGKRDDAAKVLDAAIGRHPDSIAARYMRLALAVTLGSLDDAKAQLAKMKEIRAKDLRTVYGDALVSFASRDYPHARDMVQQVLSSRPDDLAALYLAGLVDYQLGVYSSAEDALRKVVTRAPANSGARRALAMVYLRTGRGSQAIDALQPALNSTPNDAALLRVLGEAYLASGDTAQAAHAYEKANSIDHDIGSEVRLAQVRFAGGDTDRAFQDLEQLSAEDKEGIQPDLALFFNHLRRREYDKALAAADAVAKKEPKSPVPYNLRGLVALAKRDLKTARGYFEKALEVNPSYFAAANNLATIDIQEGHPQTARERYERMLKASPRDEQLLIAYAQVLTLAGAASDEIRKQLDAAIVSNPPSVRARVARIDFDMRRRDGKAAVAAAQAALAVIPDDPRLLSALGAAQVLAGDSNQAINTYGRLVQLQPKSALPLLQLAESQAAAKEWGAAIDSARKAIALQPDYSPAWGVLAKTQIASGHADEALSDAKKLEQERPKSALGFALEGEIRAAQKQWPEAAAAYREAFSRMPQGQIAVRYYATLDAAGKTADADAMAKKWMADHPDDTTVPAFLADNDLAHGRADRALAGYQRVLKIDPNNVLALNNIGWILTDRKDPAGLEYAERAHRLAPFNPGILDTLGLAYLTNGDPKRAVQLLGMATTMNPSSADIRLHLAQALAASGDKAAARAEVEPLTKLDIRSPVRAQAEKLLSSL